jgi:NADH:ubiquinone oxidoreductase subunit F (NADH-binding)
MKRVLDEAIHEALRCWFDLERRLRFGIRFDVLHRGAGATCGEETALIESFEGKPLKASLKASVPSLVSVSLMPQYRTNAGDLVAVAITSSFVALPGLLPGVTRTIVVPLFAIHR